MFAFLLAAALAGSSAPSTAASDSAKPLRELVYNMSVTAVGTGSRQSFGSIDTAMATGGFSATLTVDVMQVDGFGTMLVRTNVVSKAQNFRGSTTDKLLIHPDGSLVVLSTPYDIYTSVLLPYFGVSYFSGHDLQLGASWSIQGQEGKNAVRTDYNVSKIDGDNATITFTTKGERLPDGFVGDVDTTLVYDAPLLVPVSLTVRRHGTINDTGALNETIRFDRVSDSKQP